MTARSTDQANATTIKNETTPGANTATRVGTNLLNITQNAAYTEDVGTSIAQLFSGFSPTGNSRTVIFEDWIESTTVPTTSILTQDGGLYCDASGTGAVGAFQTSTVTERGLLRYSTGTTTSGFYGFVGGGASNLAVKVQTSDGLYVCERIAVANLSDATDTFISFCGLTSAAQALGNAALVVQHDRSIDTTHWVFTVVTGGTPTNLVTTVTITPGQFYVLEMVKLPGSNTVTCYIDGTSVGTLTLPAATAVMQFASYIKKSAGATARTQDVDWIGLQLVQPNKRAASFLA